MSDFALSLEISQSTHPITIWDDNLLLLVDDQRFPWMMIVPMIPKAREWTDLNLGQQHQALLHINKAYDLMNKFFKPEKINLGILGNIVPQLHIHIVGRHQKDVAWPGPVWGFGSPQPYHPNQKEELIMELRKKA